MQLLNNVGFEMLENFNYFSKSNLKKAGFKRLPRKQKKKQKKYVEVLNILFNYIEKKLINNEITTINGCAYAVKKKERTTNE